MIAFAFLVAPVLASAAPQAAPPAEPPVTEGATVTVTGKATLDNASVLQAARALKAGEFIWAPQAAPDGPMLMVVNLETQRAVVYRNALPVAITTVSSGKPGHETPTGIFTILQKQKMHHSNLYDSAPMPFMQRLTWDGIALHAGNLPGHAASHGCVRLPAKLAALLYSQTALGMTVVVTKRAELPAVVSAGDLIAAKGAASASPAPTAARFWEPARSPVGAVSIVISSSDRALVAIRGGRIIGRLPATVTREVMHPYLYTLGSGAAADTRNWSRIALPGQQVEDDLTPADLDLPADTRRALETVMAPGTTLVVTPDSLTGVSSLKDFVQG